MKKCLDFRWGWAFQLFLSLAITSCTEKKNEGESLALNSESPELATASKEKKALTTDFKTYWYAGDAEITSYSLEQARYGEIREGKAVLIFVTEPFLQDVQVKADRKSDQSIPVLKLNKTKKYLTGIYPYSIMSSTFYPVYDNQHAIKTSLSVQEWCGHVYSQLNNREDFEFTSHSYFEGEADQKSHLNKAILENEIWNRIRIDPSDLPNGEISIIPSLEYFRVQHKEVKAYNATATLTQSNGLSTYVIDYKDTDRKLSIHFSAEFPYEIQGWEEEFKSGFGPNAKPMISKGTKLKSIKTPYWRQNSNAFIGLRDSLAL